jgi:hypothetical protein
MSASPASNGLAGKLRKKNPKKRWSGSMARKKTDVEAEIKKVDGEYKKLKKERDVILQKGIGDVAATRKKAVKMLEDAQKTIDQCDVSTKNMKKTVEQNDVKIDVLIKKLEALVNERKTAV